MTGDSSALISQVISSSLLLCRPWPWSDNSRDPSHQLALVPLPHIVLRFWLALVLTSVRSPAAHLLIVQGYNCPCALCGPWSFGKDNLVEFIWRQVLYPIWPGSTGWKVALTLSYLIFWLNSTSHSFLPFLLSLPWNTPGTQDMNRDIVIEQLYTTSFNAELET